jgi:hypothetical protein
VPRDGAEQQNLNALLNRVGYRLRVSRLSVMKLPHAYRFSLTWENDGIAPFYFDWSAALRFESENGHAVVVQPLDFLLSTVLPGVPTSVTVNIPRGDLPAGRLHMSVGILDPDTGAPGVALAMDVASEQNWYSIQDVVN